MKIAIIYTGYKNQFLRVDKINIPENKLQELKKEIRIYNICNPIETAKIKNYK